MNLEITNPLIIKKKITPFGHEITIQFENKMDPDYCNLLLMTFIWTITENQFSCKEICVFNRSKNRFEDITSCYSPGMLEGIHQEVTDNLNDYLKKDQSLLRIDHTS